MALETPALKDTVQSPLSSRYVKTDEIPWEPIAEAPGVEVKVLVQDAETGIFTGLFRLAPGAIVPDHVHTALEQTYVLEGTFADQEGVARAGDFIWRPAGSRHEAFTEDGCVILGLFMKPNKFLK